MTLFTIALGETDSMFSRLHLRRCEVRKIFSVALLLLCLLTGVVRSGAEEAGEAGRISGSSPAADMTAAPSADHGHISSPEQKTSRAAKLKAKIKAIEERRLHAVEKPVPVAHQTARGSEQVKEKMKASEESGKKATQDVKNWFSGIAGTIRKFSRKHGISPKDGGKRALEEKPEREMSFKEQLKFELEKQRERKKAK